MGLQFLTYQRAFLENCYIISKLNYAIQKKQAQITTFSFKC